MNKILDKFIYDLRCKPVLSLYSNDTNFKNIIDELKFTENIKLLTTSDYDEKYTPSSIYKSFNDKHTDFSVIDNIDNFLIKYLIDSWKSYSLFDPIYSPLCILIIVPLDLQDEVLSRPLEVLYNFTLPFSLRNGHFFCQELPISILFINHENSIDSGCLFYNGEMIEKEISNIESMIMKGINLFITDQINLLSNHFKRENQIIDTSNSLTIKNSVDWRFRLLANLYFKGGQDDLCTRLLNSTKSIKYTNLNYIYPLIEFTFLLSYNNHQSATKQLSNLFHKIKNAPTGAMSDYEKTIVMTRLKIYSLKNGMKDGSSVLNINEILTENMNIFKPIFLYLIGMFCERIGLLRKSSFHLNLAYSKFKQLGISVEEDSDDYIMNCTGWWD